MTNLNIHKTTKIESNYSSMKIKIKISHSLINSCSTSHVTPLTRQGPTRKTRESRDMLIKAGPSSWLPSPNGYVSANTIETRGFRIHLLPTTQTASPTRTASSHPNRAVRSRLTPQTTRRSRSPCYHAPSRRCSLRWNPPQQNQFPGEPFSVDRSGK